VPVVSLDGVFVSSFGQFVLLQSKHAETSIWHVRPFPSTF